MSTRNLIQNLRQEMLVELTSSLLPYWMKRTADADRGGYHGRIDGNNVLDPDGPRSAILNTRILWTFASSFRVLQNPEYRTHMLRAFNYIEKHFIDHINGGLYWSVDADGNSLDTRKHTYAQSFAIYAYAEMFRATGDVKARDRAIGLFDLLERHAYLSKEQAYYEAFDMEWNKLADVRLSSQDIDTQRSTNTHLHLIEAFTNLYKIWPNEVLKTRILELLTQFQGPVFNPANKHFYAFFDVGWNPVTDVYSFGHDIETVWLMLDAAKAVGDENVITSVKEQLLNVAEVILNEGIDTTFGGLYNTGSDGVIIDSDKHWWPQAEAIVGFFYAYELGGDERFLNTASGLWEYINTHIIDHTNGEWFFRLNREGKPSRDEDKVGFWKCPYHSARACLEIYELTRDLIPSE